MSQNAEIGEHVLTLNYYNTDDGIWLVCSCGWRENLGYRPTVDGVIAARDHHAT